MSEEKKGFFARLKAGLTKTRDNIVRGIDAVFSGFSAIDEDFYEELEEILIMGDIGVAATGDILERLKVQIREQHVKEPSACKQLLVDSIKEQMRVDETAYDFEQEQSVIMVIGVNGVGKTTSVGKLAGKLKGQGRKVLIAAADTFRAAAGDQLAEWARRADVPMVGGNEGADPASVVFDAVTAAKARGVDVLLIDTAGRLHNKKNLMEELRKMNRIIDREFPDAHRENLIVLDGTTGQNALVQAREFGEVAELTGIILTKMDGTAKGGIAVAIQSELKVPVKYIGVGETVDDLQKFDSDDFVNALFDVRTEDVAADDGEDASTDSGEGVSVEDGEGAPADGVFAGVDGEAISAEDREERYADGDEGILEANGEEISAEGDEDVSANDAAKRSVSGKEGTSEAEGEEMAADGEEGIPAGGEEVSRDSDEGTPADDEEGSGDGDREKTGKRGRRWFWQRR